MQKEICWHDSSPALCSGPWTSTSGKSTSGTHGFWWPLQDETQGTGQIKTFSQGHITKPSWPSVAHWRGPCDQDAKTGRKQPSRGNRNWLSPFYSFTAPPSLSECFLHPFNIAFVPPLTLAHTYSPNILTQYSHTTRIPRHVLPDPLTLFSHTKVSHFTI